METSSFFSDWHYWFVAAFLLMILEVFVPGFVLGCISIGCFGGLAASLLTDSWEIQLIVASAVSVLAFIFIRPFALKKLFREDALKTNVDSLIGRKAKVSKSFDRETLKGRVAVDGDDWMAYSNTDGELDLGDVVLIEKVDSNTLYIRPIKSI